MAVVAVLAMGAMTAGQARAAPTQVMERPDLARRTFDLINGYRASLGLAQLAWDGRLAAAAAWHAAWVASRCRYERVDSDGVKQLRLADGCTLPHQDYLGRWAGERAVAFGFPYAWAVGENIAGGSEGPEGALAQWQRSPGHDANQRRPDYALLGVGVACSVYRDDTFAPPDLCIYVADFALAVDQGAAPGGGGSPRPAPRVPTGGDAAGGGGGAAGPAPGGTARPAKEPCAGKEAAPLPAEVTTYVVQPGDTLAGIAARFLGDASRYCDIAAWNGIGAPYLLRVGQELKVPAPPGDGGGAGAGPSPSGGGAPEAGGGGEGPAVDGGGAVAAPPAPQIGAMEEGALAPAPDLVVPPQPKEGRHPLVAFVERVGRWLKGLWPW